MESTTNNSTSYYTNKFQESSISSYIPTSIYTQKESRLIVIHRDTLQIRIHDFLEHYVKWGTTISLAIGVIPMIASAIAACNEQMKGKALLLFVLYVVSATTFTIMLVFALCKHWHHRNKNINTLMTDIDKACNKPASQTEQERTDLAKISGRTPDAE